MPIVYVLNKQGKPLMPTRRRGHVRHLLKEKRAVVVSTAPFTIRLKEETNNETQRLVLGIDPGRTNIGVSVVKEDGTCVFSATAETNNKDVPKHMEDRKRHRMASRQGERKRRQRRAVANGTCFDTMERILPGCEKPIVCNHIRNTEARFNNRKRPAGWLTPTARHLLACHINLVKKLQKLLPITDVVLELNSFAFMAMDSPYVQRWQYQQGPLHGLCSVEDAVSAQQGGKCIFCDAPIVYYHHVVPRSKGGSETLPNRAGLCEKHHDLVHKDQEWADKLADKKAGLNKKYGALSVLNQVIPQMLDELAGLFPDHTFSTDGRSTARYREVNGIAKAHFLDAYCIACSALEEVAANPPEDHLELRRFRRHDRAIVSRQEERKYLLDGKVVAKNRHKRTEQKVDSLEEFRAAHPEDVGRLKVVKGLAKYKDPNRVLPGAIYLVNGKRMVLQGRHGKSRTGKPNYLEFVGKGNFTPTKCRFLSIGGGWQFI